MEAETQGLAHGGLRMPCQKARILGNGKKPLKDFKERINVVGFVSCSGNILMPSCVCLHAYILYPFKSMGNHHKGVSL